jgi:hypothetical protein
VACLAHMGSGESMGTGRLWEGGMAWRSVRDGRPVRAQLVWRGECGVGHAGRLTPMLGLGPLGLAPGTVAVGRCALRPAQLTIQKVFQYSNYFLMTELIQICKIRKWYFQRFKNFQL